MQERTPKELFLESLDRCEENDGFIPSFYERFLSTSEDVRIKFQHTDFEHQNRMLLRSLRLAAAAASGEPEGLRDLRERAESHNRDHLNIEPRFYDIWLRSVIATASETDSQWCDEIENAWHSILTHIISQMIKRY